MKLIVSLGRMGDVDEYYYGLKIKSHESNKNIKGSILVTLKEQTLSIPGYLWNNPRIINDDNWWHGRGEEIDGQGKRLASFGKRLEKYETEEEVIQILYEETRRYELAIRKLKQIREPNRVSNES